MNSPLSIKLTSRALLLVSTLLVAGLFAPVQKIVAAEVQQAETVADPATEARIKVLAKELRCLVCQNQTLGESDAGLAVDLRNEIRGLMVGGASDQQVIAHLVERYGDFVRYRPPVKPTTFLLWFGPLILMVLGGALLILTLRRRSVRTDEAALSNVEQARLERLLRHDNGDNKS